MQYSPDVRLGIVIDTIDHRDDETIALHTSDGGTLLTRTMIVTAGHGAFEPRKLGVDTLEAFAGNGLHYYVSEKASFTGKRVALVGGGDSALDWAIELPGHRRAPDRADPPARPLPRPRVVRQRGAASGGRGRRARS